MRSGVRSPFYLITLLTCLLPAAAASPCLAWTPAGPWGGVIHGLVTHPSYQDTIFAVTGNGVYRYGGSLPWVPYPSTSGHRVLAATVSPSLGSLFAVADTTRGPFNFSAMSPAGELYALDPAGGTFAPEGVADVTALTTCGSGDVLAGTSTGEVHRIAGDGSGRTLSLSIAGPITALEGRAGSTTVYMARGGGPSDILVSPDCGAVTGSWSPEHNIPGRISALGRDGDGRILAGTSNGQVYTRGAGGWDAAAYGTGLPSYPVVGFSSLPDGTTVAVLRDHSWNFAIPNDGPAGLFGMPAASSGSWIRQTRFDEVSSFIADVIPQGTDMLVAFDYAGIRRAAADDLLPGEAFDEGVRAVPLERIVVDPRSPDRILAVGPGGVYEHRSGVWRHHLITTPVSLPFETLQEIRESGFISAAFAPDTDGFWVGGNSTGLLRAAPVAAGSATCDWYRIYYAYLRNVIRDVLPDPYNSGRLWWATSNGVHFTTQANTTTSLTSGQVINTETFISHDLDLEIVTEGVYNMVAAVVPSPTFSTGLLASQFIDDGASASQSWAGALYGNYTLKAARYLPTRSLSGTTMVLSGVSMNNTLGMVAREGGSWTIDPAVPGPEGLPHNPQFRSLEVPQGEDGDGSMDAFAVVGNGMSPTGVYHSTGTLPGAQWVDITGNLALSMTRPTCVALDPRDGNLLWVTTDRASAFTLRGTHFLDSTPPGFPAGSSFDAVGSTGTEIFFMWAAPGDDDSLPGWAQRYELRCAGTPLGASAQFPIWGTLVDCDAPRISHSVEVQPVEVPSLGLAAGTVYCALRALDEQDQASVVLTTAPTAPLDRQPVTDVSFRAASDGVRLTWSPGQLSTDPYFQNFGEILIERQIGGEWDPVDRLTPSATQWQDSWPDGTYSPGQTLTYRITALDGVQNGAAVTQLVTIPEPKKGGGGGGGGCFIATAAFGSPDEKDVLILRSYRDSFLSGSSWGRAMVRAYYATSPPLARIIAERSWLKGMTRLLLKPVSAAASGTLKGTWMPVILALVLMPIPPVILLLTVHGVWIALCRFLPGYGRR